MAQPTATATQELHAPAGCAGAGDVIYGPASGTVTDRGNSPGGSPPDAITESGFAVTATFVNPEEGPWEYGIAFRDESDGSVDVVVFRDDGVWLHALSRSGQRTDTEVLDGNSLLGLMTGPGDLNEVRLFARDGKVDVSINESQLTTIKLSVAAESPVLVEPVFGFVGGLEGSVVYRDFTISCMQG